MNKSRLEAFSDGVLAILITILVLDLHAPHSPQAAALLPLWPVALSYLMSFVYIGIYWNNHHHLWHAVERVTGGVLWANLHLLFWLSLLPFATAWMGEHPLEPAPEALYGIVLLGAGTAYYVMTRVLLAAHDRDSMLARALGSDVKGRVSLVIYAAAIVLALALRQPLPAHLLYWVVALVWLVPDRRFERLARDQD
jgi:uncharacterized membrane protein